MASREFFYALTSILCVMINCQSALIRPCAVAAALTCSGSCECSPIIATSGVITDGPGLYGNNMDCKYTLISNGLLSVRFTSFNTQSEVDLVSIKRCTTTGCQNQEEVGNWSGVSAPLNVAYSSVAFRFPVLQISFTSNGTQVDEGWSANWAVSEVDIVSTMTCSGTCGNLCTASSAMQGDIITEYPYSGLYDCTFAFASNALMSIVFTHLSGINDTLEYFEFKVCKTVSCEDHIVEYYSPTDGKRAKTMSSELEYPYAEFRFWNSGAEEMLGWSAKWWLHAGLQECMNCPRLQFWNLTSCAYCPPGTYLQMVDRVQPVRSDCIACSKGKYSTTGQDYECISCGAGTYSDAPEAAQCKNCEAGTFSAELEAVSSNTCQPCAAGTASEAPGAAMCTPCTGGSFSLAGATICTQCMPGSTTLPWTCAVCAAGKFSASASSICTNCPAGTYSAAVGATSETQCIKCTVGTHFSPSTGNVDELGCVDQRYRITQDWSYWDWCHSSISVTLNGGLWPEWGPRGPLGNVFVSDTYYNASYDARTLHSSQVNTSVDYDTVTFTVQFIVSNRSLEYFVTPYYMMPGFRRWDLDTSIPMLFDMGCRVPIGSISCVMTLPRSVANEDFNFGLRVNIGSVHSCEHTRVNSIINHLIGFAAPNTSHFSCPGDKFPEYLNLNKVCTPCAGRDVCDRGQYIRGCFPFNTSLVLLRSRCVSCRHTFLDYLNLVYTPRPTPLQRQCQLSCAAGSVISDGGCEKCEQGKYSPSLDSAECATCEDGKTTVSIGSVNASECVGKRNRICAPGFSYREGSCQPCPVDTYQGERIFGAPCLPCPNGLTTGGRVRARSVRECVFCKAHAILEETGGEIRCVPCAACTYVDQVHHRLRSCMPCPSMRKPSAKYGGQCSVSIKNKGGCFSAAPIQDIHDCAEDVYIQTGDVPTTMQMACEGNGIYSLGACARVHDFAQLDASYSRQLWQPLALVGQKQSISFNLIANDAQNDCRNMAQGLKNADKDFVNVCQLHKTRTASSPGRFFFIPTTYEAYDPIITGLGGIPNQYRNFECTVCRTVHIPIVNIFEHQDVFPGMKIYSFAEAMPSDAQGYTRYFDFARLGLEYFGTQVINKEYEECKIAFAESVSNLARCWGLRYRFLKDTSTAGEWKSHNARDYPDQYTNIHSILLDVERRVHARYAVPLLVGNAMSNKTNAIKTNAIKTTVTDADNNTPFNFTYLVLRVSGVFAPQNVNASFETATALPEVWRSGDPHGRTALIIYNVSHIRTHPRDLWLVVDQDDTVHVQVLVCTADMICRRVVKYSTPGSRPIDDPQYDYRICSTAEYVQGGRAAQLQHGGHFERMRNSVGVGNVCGLHRMRLDATQQARLSTLISTNTWVQQNLCGRTIDDMNFA